MRVRYQLLPTKKKEFDAALIVLKENEKSLSRYKDLLGKTVYEKANQSLKKKKYDFSPLEFFSVELNFPWIADRLVIVRLKDKDFLEGLRKATGLFFQFSQKEKIENPALFLGSLKDDGSTIQEICEAVTEGFILASFEDLRYRSSKKKQKGKTLSLLSKERSDSGKIQKAIQNVQAICEAVFHTRLLVNAPANYLTPRMMARDAAAMAKKLRIKCQSFGSAALRRMKMGGILAVSKGSIEEPQLIVLDYGPSSRPVDFCFVGKGITFDSGGISIKPSEKMDQMKYDMAGGAAVIGILEAVARLKLPLRVIGIVAASENLPSGSAVKPGDVVWMGSGKSVEVLNTDAEGRMVLGDALFFAQRFKPKAVVDLATLTGACIVALGHHATGMMGNDKKLLKKIEKAGDKTGERVWTLPAWEVYEEQIKGELADIKNIAKGGAGTITAGMFLKQFVKYPWVHLDIAGVAWTDRPLAYCPKGATGTGVRLLVDMMRDSTKNRQ